jgi:formylmethanofuran dehydrogenase subunit E-like metal-binding protein
MYQIVLTVTILFTFCSNLSALTLKDNVSQAMEKLLLSKGDLNMLLMTNAPYVKVDEKNALPYLNQVQELTGCTVGKGNLLFFQRPQSHPLRLMLFKKHNGDSIIISRVGQAWQSEFLNISADTIALPAFWENIKRYKAAKDMFTLAAIANVWAQGGPYDFLKSAELHNHICPGLTSGYLIAHYVLKTYPLQTGERYTMIACPVWCKEDALQVVMDCTPGKKGLIVKQLSEDQKKRVAVSNPAGLVLIWNAKKKSGKGVALSFDFDRIRSLSPKGSPKAASVLSVLKHLNQPERFVETAAEFNLDEKQYNSIIQAGVNPYAVAGLMK